MMSICFQTYQSPVGILFLASQEQTLCGVIFEPLWSAFTKRLPEASFSETSTAVLQQTKQQLDEYFAGKRQKFSIPLQFISGTEFQKKVWTALQLIPFGATATYKQQAASVGSPLASRAVGHANGLNPIAIILPCHRIIGSDGSLTGFAGGLENKKVLLSNEAIHKKLTSL
jgi:methylated-DNA-[protein]-cysteine S-methyltransferase